MGGCFVEPTLESGNPKGLLGTTGRKVTLEDTEQEETFPGRHRAGPKDWWSRPLLSVLFPGLKVTDYNFPHPIEDVVGYSGRSRS